MWFATLIFIFVILLLVGSSSSNKNKRMEEVRRWERERYVNAGKPQPTLKVGNEEDSIEKLKEQAELVAKRTGAKIKDWGDVKTDSLGRRYIECHMESGDNEGDTDRMIDEQERVFGDKILRNTIYRDKPATPETVSAYKVDIKIPENVESDKVDIRIEHSVNVSIKSKQIDNNEVKDKTEIKSDGDMNTDNVI